MPAVPAWSCPRLIARPLAPSFALRTKRSRTDSSRSRGRCRESKGGAFAAARPPRAAGTFNVACGRDTRTCIHGRARGSTCSGARADACRRAGGLTGLRPRPWGFVARCLLPKTRGQFNREQMEDDLRAKAKATHHELFKIKAKVIRAAKSSQVKGWETLKEMAQSVRRAAPPFAPERADQRLAHLSGPDCVCARACRSAPGGRSATAGRCLRRQAS